MSIGLVLVVITLTIAIMLFVLVPILVTTMAPGTTIVLRQANNVVTAEVTRFTLLVIPITRSVISPLQDVESSVRGSKYIKEERARNRKASTQIADGSLVLIGENDVCCFRCSFTA